MRDVVIEVGRVFACPASVGKVRLVCPGAADEDISPGHPQCCGNALPLQQATYQCTLAILREAECPDLRSI